MNKFVLTGTVEERLQQFIDFINAHYKAGSFIKLGYHSNPKTKKAFADRLVEKTTEGVFRMGIEYANTAAFKDLGRDLASLPASQKRLEDYGKYLQVTVSDDGNIESYKVRIFTVEGAKSTSTYTIDGQPTTYEELVEMGAISPKKPSANPLIMFTVFLQNIDWAAVA